MKNIHRPLASRLTAAIAAAALVAAAFSLPVSAQTTITQTTIPQTQTSGYNYNIYSYPAQGSAVAQSQTVSSSYSPFQSYSVGASSGHQTLSTVIQLVVAYMNAFMVLLMGFAVVMFVWYVIKYFIRPDADRKDAGQYVLYSVLGFFVILSVWGLVNILTNTFGLANSNSQYSTWASFANIFPK